MVSPSSSVYTPTPPQIFEIGKCSVKMHLKHHEKQVEDILNYLEELSFRRIEKMEEGRINRMITQRNSNELKTELKRIRTQIIKLQKKQLGQKDKIAFAHYRIFDLEQIIEKMLPKRTSTSAALAMTQDAIRQLVADSVATSSKAQAANMANTDNTNKNTGTSGTPVARKGINDHKIKNCKSKGPAMGSNLLSVCVTCHACGEKGHYKSQCSKTDTNTFHVSKKSLCDESLIIPKKEIWLDDKLNYVEESVEIMDREVKQLRQRCIPIVKVRWNSEFTWEREDQICAKYPHLFSNIIVSLNYISRHVA
ncbi:reverse transcriptase domain-containing protein [Tanacetum coccineum]